MLKKIFSKRRQKIILVRGACGAGKSTWIEKQKRKGDQVIDFKEFMDYEWFERPRMAFDRIDPSAKRVFIEAIFGVHAPSLSNMIDLLARWDKDIQCYAIVVHRALNVCAEAIKNDPEEGDKQSRIDLLGRYWYEFDKLPYKNKLLELKSLKSKAVREGLNRP